MSRTRALRRRYGQARKGLKCNWQVTASGANWPAAPGKLCGKPAAPGQTLCTEHMKEARSLYPWMFKGAS